MLTPVREPSQNLPNPRIPRPGNIASPRGTCGMLRGMDVLWGEKIPQGRKCGRQSTSPRTHQMQFPGR